MDAVESIIEPRRRPVGSGEVRRLLPWRHRRMVGPFAFVDLVGPDDLAPGSGVDVDAHPHIGLSTLTYLFAGELVHRDSIGSVRSITPGDVNWMTAGRGVTHTERSPAATRGSRRTLHGLQTWVALPNGEEDGPPSFEHAPAAAIPHIPSSDVSIRVAAGTAWGETSPVSGSSPLVLAELGLSGREGLSVDATHPERAVLAVEGVIRLDGRVVEPGQLAVLAADSTPHLDGRGRAVLLGGAPVGPRHIWWNFVHSDPDRIEAAKQDWAEQRFPTVPGDHDPSVPLPR